MIVEVGGMTTNEKEKVLEEIHAIGAEWKWNGLGGLIVEAGTYTMQGFTMWLDSLDIIWSEL